jgi:pimeloyl-ACP methyl ester carboxylesterase
MGCHWIFLPVLWTRGNVRRRAGTVHRDRVTSTRFAPSLTEGIKGAELVVFEHLSHAGMHENAEEFNRVTLEFLTRQKS